MRLCRLGRRIRVARLTSASANSAFRSARGCLVAVGIVCNQEAEGLHLSMQRSNAAPASAHRQRLGGRAPELAGGAGAGTGWHPSRAKFSARFGGWPLRLTRPRKIPCSRQTAPGRAAQPPSFIACCQSLRFGPTSSCASRARSTVCRVRRRDRDTINPDLCTDT